MPLMSCYEAISHLPGGYYETDFHHLLGSHEAQAT